MISVLLVDLVLVSMWSKKSLQSLYGKNIKRDDFVPLRLTALCDVRGHVLRVCRE